MVSRSDFGLTATPASVTVIHGQSATYTVSVTGTGGFSGSVAMSVSGAPSGSVVGWSRQPVVAPGSTTLTVRTSSSAPRRAYALVITGTSGTIRHQVSVTLTVT